MEGSRNQPPASASCGRCRATYANGCGVVICRCVIWPRTPTPTPTQTQRHNEKGEAGARPEPGDGGQGSLRLSALRRAAPCEAARWPRGHRATSIRRPGFDLRAATQGPGRAEMVMGGKRLRRLSCLEGSSRALANMLALAPSATPWRAVARCALLCLAQSTTQCESRRSTPAPHGTDAQRRPGHISWPVSELCLAHTHTHVCYVCLNMSKHEALNGTVLKLSAHRLLSALAFAVGLAHGAAPSDANLNTNYQAMACAHTRSA